MTSEPARPKGEVRAAATELRAAVHLLAQRSVEAAPSADALQHAAELVRTAAERLDGEQLLRGCEAPATADHAVGLRHYRHRSLFQGELHPFSPALQWADTAGPDGAAGYGFRVTLSRLYEGPPGAVHGGYLAGLFDELLGAVQGRAAEGGGFTGRLTIRYRRLTPIDQELRFTGWIASAAGRRIVARGTCHVGDRLCSEAEGLFVRPPARKN